MKLSEFKNHLNNVSQINFVQPNGTFVPSHFHITEAGLVSKHFIDCGGTVRTEKAVNFQVWTSKDTDHKLGSTKLLKIISISEKLFGNEDLDIEVEYQTDTVGKYGLDFEGENFLLTAKQTDCLAKDNCGVPQYKQKLQLAELETQPSCCTPGGGCC
jgi:Family of unknown function (DUF6428)